MSSAPAQQEHGLLPDETPNPGLEAGEDLLFDLGAAVDDDHDLQVHTVLIGNIGLVLPKHEVSELIERPAVCRLPNTLPWLDGVISVRGSMIPVFDLHVLFELEPPAGKRRLIVVGQNGAAVLPERRTGLGRVGRASVVHRPRRKSVKPTNV
jgi:chemotaxis signal transduction protein